MIEHLNHQVAHKVKITIFSEDTEVTEVANAKMFFYVCLHLFQKLL